MLNIYPGPGYVIPHRDREVVKEKRSDLVIALVALSVFFALGALTTLGVVALIVIAK